MEEICDKVFSINFKELKNLNFDYYGEKIGLKVFKDNVKYEFILKLKESEKMLVLGSGAIGLNKNVDRTRPYFERHSWEFNVSTIYYNDPTYYVDDHIVIGWCIGTENDWYLESIKEILEVIFRKIQILNHNILFYGSSAGGFTSLMLATMFKNSKVLADIPQFFLHNFKSKEGEPYGCHDVIKYGFSSREYDDIINEYNYRFDFIEFMKKEKYVPQAYILMEYAVDNDIKTQYFPFFKKICEAPFQKFSNNIQCIFKNDFKGVHAPMYRIELIQMINNLLESNVSYDNNFNYNNARIDIKNKGNRNNSIKIISDSDGAAVITFPKWFDNDEGKGLKINTSQSDFHVKLKCIGDGELNVFLRGVLFKDKNGKKLPIYIKYKKVVLNDEILLDGEEIVWHDHPYIIKRQVKHNEIVDFHIVWSPL